MTSQVHSDMLKNRDFLDNPSDFMFMFQVILINIPAFATSHKYMKDIYNSLSTVGHFTTHTFTYQINLNSSRTKQYMEELQTQIF